jgi:hypothetical protein
MAGATKRQLDSGVKRFGLPKVDISGYADMSLDEQIAAFSRLVLENPARAIYKVWLQLDDVDRSIVMWRLGCFDGENAPQRIYAQAIGTPESLFRKQENRGISLVRSSRGRQSMNGSWEALVSKPADCISHGKEVSAR